MVAVAAERPRRDSPAGGTGGSRPELVAVEGRRRRWPAALGAVVFVAVIIAMLGAAVFHTQLAERQLRIDDLDRTVRSERERFDELRRDRAVLRSPERIGSEAEALGMVRGETSDFVSVDAMDLAVQIAAAGPSDGTSMSTIDGDDPLDQFRDVKSVSDGQS